MIREDIMEQMAQKYNQLTRSGKKVADYIFSHQYETQFMSITSLAEECGVAEATIFRFCKTLGFEGYNEVKLSLAKSQGGSNIAPDYEIYGSVSPDDEIDDVCKKLYTSNVDALTQTLSTLRTDQVEQAVEYLSAAERVFCVGQGGSLLIAMEAWGRFITASPKFYCIEDSHMQAMAAALLSERDVVLFCSYSGATKDMLDVLRPAKERGAKVVLLTRFAKSPAAAYADVVLQCSTSEGPLQMGSVAAKIALLFVVDVLFNDFCRKNPELTLQNREATSASLANKML